MPLYPNQSKPNDPGLYVGKVYRLEYELNIANGAPATVIKVVSPVPFCLRKQTFSLAAGALRWEARTGGTEGGAFNTVVTPVGMNRLSTRPSAGYTPQISWSTGGTHTGGTRVDLVIAESAGGSSTQSNIQSDSEFRYLPAGTYYLVFQNTGNSTVRGVYHLIFEEL